MSAQPDSPPPSIADDPSSSSSPSTESTAPSSSEQVLITLPSTTIHLIDPIRSIPLASGTFEIIRLLQNDAVVAVLARIGDQIQWPLAKDEPVVKLDDSHYFFSLRVPNGMNNNGSDEIIETDTMVLNYGVTVKGNEEGLVEAFDRTLDVHSCFSVGRVEGVDEGWLAAARDDEAAYWTTVAPNVEEYSGSVARMIAAGSGQLIKGILWCGDVTVDRLKWGNEFLKGRLGEKEKDAEVSPEVMERIKMVEKVTKMTEQVAAEVLSGVLKVTGYITSSIVNSGVGKKFFSLLPGEIILASLDAFSKVFDAVEAAGKNVMSTTSVVTTELVSGRYGEEAAKATNSGLGAAGHAIGTAWAIFKIRKAINPKSVMKPTALARAAAAGGSLETKTKVMKQV